MNVEFDLGGEWSGRHLNECQREKCENPQGSLINCFSCERAFCKACWKKVLKMPPVMKAAKGFQNCSVGLPRQSPHRELPDQGPLSARNRPTVTSNARPGPPTTPVEPIVLGDLDDGEPKRWKARRASERSVSDELESNNRSTFISQQTGPSCQPIKRPLEGTGEDVEDTNAKRHKSTTSTSSSPGWNRESPEHVSSSNSQPSTPPPSHDGLNGGNIGARYISEGPFHTLEDLEMLKTSTVRQQEENLAMARQALLHMGNNMLRETPNTGNEMQTHQTRSISDNITDAEDAGDPATLTEGETRKREDLSRTSEDDRTSNEQPHRTPHKGPSPGAYTRFTADATRDTVGSPVSQDKAGPAQGTVDNVVTPTNHHTQPQGLSRRDSSADNNDSTTPQPRFTRPSHDAGQSLQSQSVGQTASTQPENSGSISTSGGTQHQLSFAQNRTQGSPNASYGAPPGMEQLPQGYPTQVTPRPGGPGPSNSSSCTMSNSHDEQRRFNEQSPQHRLQPYHRYQLPAISSSSPQGPLPSPSPSPTQIGPHSGYTATNGSKGPSLPPPPPPPPQQERVPNSNKGPSPTPPPPPPGNINRGLPPSPQLQGRSASNSNGGPHPSTQPPPPPPGNTYKDPLPPPPQLQRTFVNSNGGPPQPPPPPQGNTYRGPAPPPPQGNTYRGSAPPPPPPQRSSASNSDKGPPPLPPPPQPQRTSAANTHKGPLPPPPQLQRNFAPNINGGPHTCTPPSGNTYRGPAPPPPPPQRSPASNSDKGPPPPPPLPPLQQNPAANTHKGPLHPHPQPLGNFASKSNGRPPLSTSPHLPPPLPPQAHTYRGPAPPPPPTQRSPTSNNYGGPPRLPLPTPPQVQRSSFSSDLRIPSQTPCSGPGISGPGLPQSIHGDRLFPNVRNTFNEIGVENLPAKQSEGDIESARIIHCTRPHVLDITLQHTFYFESTVSSVRFSQDGRHLATGCHKSLQIFDVFTGKEEFNLPIIPADDTMELIDVTSLCVSPNAKYIVTASADRLIRVWDVESKSVRHTLVGHQREISALDFDGDSRMFASGSSDSTVRLWDVENGSQIMSLQTESCVTSVAISPDGRYVAAGCLDKGARVWNISTKAIIESLEGSAGHTSGIYSIAFSPDGNYLVTGSSDNTIKVWGLLGTSSSNLSSEATVGRRPLTLNSHEDCVLSAIMTPDAAFILSGSKDQQVHICNPSTGFCYLMITGHQDSVVTIASSPLLSPDGGRLFATGSKDKQVKIWSYKFVPFQQSSQFMIPESGLSTTNGESSPQISQHSDQQATLAPPNTQSPIKQVSAQMKYQPTEEEQFFHQGGMNSNPSLASQHASSCTNSSDQGSPSSSGGSAMHSVQVNGAVAAAIPSRHGLEVNSQPTPIENGSESITRTAEKLNPVQVLIKAQGFALRASNVFLERSQKFDCHSHDKELQAQEERLTQINSEIIQVEARYEDFLQHASEGEKDELILLKERTVGRKRQLLEECDTKKNRMVQEFQKNKADYTKLAPLINELKPLLPGVVKALQGLQALLDKLPDV